MEDLGLSLKVTPHVNGDGDIRLEVDTQYKTLGVLTLNGVPSVNQRLYKGVVTLQEGQWAVIAGMDEESTSYRHEGVLGLSGGPGLQNLLGKNTKTGEMGQTLIVIKPVITRLPGLAGANPQYFLDPFGRSSVPM